MFMVLQAVWGLNSMREGEREGGREGGKKGGRERTAARGQLERKISINMQPQRDDRAESPVKRLTERTTTARGLAAKHVRTCALQRNTSHVLSALSGTRLHLRTSLPHPEAVACEGELLNDSRHDVNEVGRGALTT